MEEFNTRNADRIRAMTDEEMASVLYHAWDNGLKPCPKGVKYPKNCETVAENCWLDRLKQEVDDG